MAFLYRWDLYICIWILLLCQSDFRSYIFDYDIHWNSIYRWRNFKKTRVYDKNGFEKNVFIYFFNINYNIFLFYDKDDNLFYDKDDNS